MAVFFLLLTIVVQVGFAVTARSMVAASVDGAARRAVTHDGDHDRDEEVLRRLEEEIRRSVPGAEIASSSIDRSDTSVTVSLRYRWAPPGPDLVPIEVEVERRRSVVVPP